ncbi:hypothetical protein AAKU55_004447, partial [Oxalobacteraceae bacterium GrIS 1.11]
AESLAFRRITHGRRYPISQWASSSIQNGIEPEKFD